MKKLLSLFLSLLIFSCPAYAVSTGSVYDTDTVLMMHCDGDDEASVFTDESTSNHTVVSAGLGSAVTDSAGPKFGTGACRVWNQVTSSRIESDDSADWDLGTGSFTLDFWFMTTNSTKSVQRILEHGDSSTNQWLLQYATTSGGIIQFISRTGSSIKITRSAVFVPLNDTWYHIAMTRNVNSVRFFINGLRKGAVGTETVTVDDNSGHLLVGVQDGGTSGLLYGWLDEIRIVKGLAVWSTANFTPATSAYTLYAAPTNSQYRHRGKKSVFQDQNLRHLGGIDEPLY